MKQKIEWYKEVLALEPASKVFFPLARMQAEDGQTEAALATLRHGLGRSPEHLEARLLLIDLLFSLKDHESVWPEVDAVSQLLGDYPGFWEAWTERMSKNPHKRDAALALNFLSETLKGQPISWSDVIEQGLGMVLARNIEGGIPAARPIVQPLRTPAPAPAPAEEAAPEAAVSFDMAEMSALAEAMAAPKPEPVQEEDFSVTPEADDEEEKFSLKTRSMAEVLAAQGDYVGALDIYEELLKAATSPNERASLEDAIARLSADISAVPVVGVPVSNEEKAQAQDKSGKGQDKGRLVDVLELLADRLESKAK